MQVEQRPAGNDGDCRAPVAALALLAGMLALYPALEHTDSWPLRRAVFDLYQQLAPREPPERLPVRIIAIDGNSLERYGQWPWPRTRVAASWKAP